MHSLSLGETISSVSFVKSLKKTHTNKNIAFSTSTITGFNAAKKNLVDTVDLIFYFPYDLKFAIRKIFKKINPKIIIIIETDIWLNFLEKTKKENIPTYLINARLSEKSFANYLRFHIFFKKAFQTFKIICAQSSLDAKRFEKICENKKTIKVVPNLKFDNKINLKEKIKREHLKIKDDKLIIIAGSTHTKEEEIIFDCFSKLLSEFKNIFLIVVPRDIKRTNKIKKIALDKKINISTSLSSDKKNNDALIIKKNGILSNLYEIADITFIGGSLIDFGGHNLLEAAYFAKPILFGKYMQDFHSIAEIYKKITLQ